MADRAISALPTASTLTASDLFVLSQSNQAKNTTWQVIIGYLTAALDGHGGIQSIAKTGTAGLVDTYTITYADSSTTTFSVTNGKQISSITQYWAVSSSNTTVPSSWQTTRQEMTPENKYLWSYFRYTYNDGTTNDTIKSVVGVYGDTGQNWYVWIRYAGEEPTQDADIGTTPDNWIGIYSGTSATAPTSYTSYQWFEIKGEKGATGEASEITSQSVTYLESTSGTVVPEGSWTTTIPSVTPGNFLWTRTILTFNDNTSTTAYSVSRFGIDGTGAVSSVNSVSPDQYGNVQLVAGDIQALDSQSVQAHLDDDEQDIADLKTSLNSVAPANKYKYYHVDCVNGSDSNDGITAPLRTLDKLFSLNLNNDLRVYFDAAGTYSTSVQYFSGMSMHLVKADAVTGDVTIDFTSVLSNDAIQFYNCYVHFKSVKVTWATSTFYFDNSGIMAEGTDFVSRVIGFNTSNLYFDGSSAYALDIRESKAKLHDLSLTCPATDGNQYLIYSRDGDLLLYGTFAYNQITVANETAILRVLRGRAKIAVVPSGDSGHKYGLDLSSCDAEVTDTVLNAFASVATSGNTISGTTTLNTQTTPKTSGNTIGQFETEEYTIGASVAVAAYTFGNEITYNITKAGYYPVGVVGWRFSGSGSTRLIPARLRLTAQSAGAGTVSMNPYNVSDTATTSVSAYASVLWVKI